MAIAKGTAKTISYKKESSWGVLAGNTGAKQLRRVTANFNLVKETYESSEIRTDRQMADFRHGVRSSEGSLNGELSPNSYADFMQALVAKDFAVGASGTGLTVTIAGAGPTYTITRSAGDWLADGFKVGTIIRLDGAGLAADNADKNLLIASVSATDLVVVTLNGSTLTEEDDPVSDVDVATIGKTTFVPATGHTDDSFTIEEWYSDIQQSEVYAGVKVNSMAVQLPASGLATVDFGFVGKDLARDGNTQYFTSPTAQGTDALLAAVNGVMLVDGAPVALITSADFTIERATENATAVGSNSIAEIFTGRIRASGNLSVYFQDGVFRGYFDEETPVSIVMVLTTDNGNGSNFLSFTLPKVKLGSFTKDDGELGLIAQTSFQAMLNDVTTNGLPATTVAIQDSSLT